MRELQDAVEDKDVKAGIHLHLERTVDVIAREEAEEAAHGRRS